MPTKPVTYRVSPEVDAELRRLAKLHGGVDKALRVLFGWASPLAARELEAVTVEEVAPRPNNRTFKPPLLKPKDKKK